VLFTLLLYPVVTILTRIPLRKYAAAALPAQLIAFSSSSSLAALPALVDEADTTLRLPKDVTGFVLPLAVTMFKFAAPVSWTFGTLFVAWFYQRDLHAAQYATIAFASTFLAFAAPGVPRGAFLMLAPLFLAIGLPIEGIGMLIAVDAIPDLFATVLNASGDMAAADVDHGNRMQEFPGDQQIPLCLRVGSGPLLLLGVLEVLIGNLAERVGSLKRR